MKASALARLLCRRKKSRRPRANQRKMWPAIGSLSSLLILLKGLPLTYNRDLQEDKGIIIETISEVLSCLNLMPRLIITLNVNKQRALEFSKSDFSNATDLADYLAMKGVPFRRIT